MTETALTPEQTQEKQAGSSGLIQFLKDVKIGRKLTIGFGVLVVLTFLIIAFSYQGSQQATESINSTGDLRVPLARYSASAQANLLRMLAATRGYLFLAEPQFKGEYVAAEEAFVADLAKLNELAAEDEDPLLTLRLGKLQEDFEAWRDLPAVLFDLRDDQLEREPAYKALAIDGSLLAGQVLIDIQSIIDSQANQPASATNLALLEDMANFQGSFAAMLSALRGYVTTQNRIYRQEYDANLTVNQFAWERLTRQTDLLTTSQQAQLESIAQNRQAFLQLPEEAIFPTLESEEWRKDLFLFKDQAVPINERMVSLLDEITEAQQQRLQSDLDQGRAGLQTSLTQTLTFGLIVLVLGIVMAIGFRSIIAGPVRRLTQVAEEIGSGQLEAKATGRVVRRNWHPGPNLQLDDPPPAQYARPGK